MTMMMMMMMMMMIVMIVSVAVTRNNNPPIYRQMKFGLVTSKIVRFFLARFCQPIN